MDKTAADSCNKPTDIVWSAIAVLVLSGCGFLLFADMHSKAYPSMVHRDLALASIFLLSAVGAWRGVAWPAAVLLSTYLGAYVLPILSIDTLADFIGAVRNVFADDDWLISLILLGMLVVGALVFILIAALPLALLFLPRSSREYFAARKARKERRMLFVAAAYVVALVVQTFFLSLDFSSFGTAAPMLASPMLMLLFGPYLVVAGSWMNECWIGCGGYSSLLRIAPIVVAHVAFWAGLVARIDVWRLFGRFGGIVRRGVLAVVAAVSVAGVWYELPVVTKYEVAVAGDKVKGDGIRLAVVTDLHSCRYGFKQRALVENVADSRPDAVLMVGDIFDDRLPDEGAKDFIVAVVSNYPCYYVSGNHEYWSERVHEMKKWLREVGVTVLEGEVVTAELKGTLVDFCGVDDPTYICGEWDEQLRRVCERSDPSHLRVLLSHRSERVPEYGSCGFDLVVSGHAHGGQWRIPFVGRGVCSPDQGFFPQYVGGEYSLSRGTRMVVSRGLARESTPLPRFFNHPELVLVDLRPSQGGAEERPAASP